jgi:WD40 repeat protein
VRLWTADGESIAELNGHTNYVYSVCWQAPDLLISCGEDKYAADEMNANVHNAIFSSIA